MKKQKTRQYLMKSPEILWNCLARGRHHFHFDLMPIRLENLRFRARINLVRSGLNLFHRRLSPWGMPLHLQIEPTNFCSLRCPVCPSGNGSLNRPPKIMEVDMFGRIMAELGPTLLTTALYGWGEPLLHPDLETILKIVEKYPCGVLLSTNGQNLNKASVIEALVKYPPTYLIVAIDGIRDETNAKYRVGAKVAPILEGVRKLAEEKKKRNRQTPILLMRFMVMKHNEHEVPRLSRFAEENHFDSLHIRTLSIIDDPTAPHGLMAPDNDKYRAYSTDQNERKRQRKEFVCEHPFITTTILADGGVLACEQDFNAKKPFGYISEKTTFKDIWFSARAKRIRKRIRNSPQNFSFCKNCPFAERPVGTCSIETFPKRKGRA